MDTQLVRDWMTPNPVTISSDTPLPDAHALLKKHGIRRLPVVDGGELKGIVTWGDIREALPSDATSLNIFELHYMLSHITVAKIMTTDVAVVAPDAPIGLAAKIMYDQRVDGLPVVEGGRVVGIITATDIFRVVIKLSGYEEERTKKK